MLPEIVASLGCYSESLKRLRHSGMKLITEGIPSVRTLQPKACLSHLASQPHEVDSGPLLHAPHCDGLPCPFPKNMRQQVWPEGFEKMSPNKTSFSLLI